MRKPTILCVEDRQNGSNGREFLLRENGYEVLVSSGRESLSLLQEMDVDAVILDCRPQEMRDGGVARRMKDLRPEVPIMMLSAPDSIPPAALHTADSFVPKGAAPEQFVDAVHDMVAAGSPFFRRWLQDWKQRVLV
jgi:CheY-like chemotaxis protein